MTTLDNTDAATASFEKPDWFTELVETIKDNPTLTTKQRVRTVLQHEPTFELLRYDVTKYRPMINGDSLQDSDISIIANVLTDQYKGLVCTFTRERANDLSLNLVRECVEGIAYEKPFNPRTAYLLDCYEKHGDSGLALLDVWLEKCGCSIDDDKKPLLGALGRKFLIQSVARVFHPGVQADMGLILYDPLGDKSKSKFWRTLAVKSEWINESGIGDLRDEKKTGELVSPYWYVIFDENSSLTRGELGALKKTWTLTKDTYRSAYDIYASDKLRQSVFGGTTNVLNLFLDEGGVARRFPIIDVTEVDTEWLKEHRDQLYAAAFSVYRQNLKSGVLTHDPDVEHGYEPVTIHNDDYLSDEERIKGNCHWWFSEKHEPRLYAMLAELSSRTLVKLAWHDELDLVLGLYVGRKVTNRELKDKLGPNAKVTEDQIGLYLSKKGIHVKVEKVNYTYIDQQTALMTQIRRSGWLIGGDVPEASSAPSLQKTHDKMFENVGETAKSVEPVMVLSPAQEVAKAVAVSSDGEDDPFLNPSAWVM
jgi:uncharacterized protein YneF (UPF0154 family)